MKKCFSFLLVFILLINCFTFTSFASENKTDSKISTKMDYSFTKQDSWFDMSRDEKLELCQIPIVIAEKMTTEALLDSILENPFTAEMLVFDSLEVGYQKVKDLIPAFQILLNRSDLSSVLVKKYNISSEKTSNQDIMKSLYLSVMLAQPEIENKLNDVDTTLFLTSLDITNKQLYSISKDEHKINADTIDSVEIAASGYYANATTTTNRGTTIAVLQFIGVDYDPDEQKALHESFASIYTYSSYVSPASLRYNCHSYAFYSQSTSNPYWINGAPVDNYMTDGSYYQVSAVPAANDRVHWHNGDHSGIVVGVGQQAGNVSIISKYGQYGVYRAFISDVSSAYGDTYYTFWRR